MEIFPITDVYFSEREGEMIDTGVIIGYEAIGTGGIVLGRGETIAEATNAGLIAMYLPDYGDNYLTNARRGCMFSHKKDV